MTTTALSPHPLTRTALRLDGAVLPLGLLAASVLGAGLLLPPAQATYLALDFGFLLLAVILAVRILAARYRRSRRRLVATLAGFVEHDAAACFTTTAEGQVGFMNQAARERFGDADGRTLVAALGDTFASPAAVLYRLQARARSSGAAREDVVLRRGHVRLSAHRLGPDGFLWRLEDLAERSHPGRSPDAMELPMLIASRQGAVLYMNDALRDLAGMRETQLDRVIADLPLRPGKVHHLLTAGGRRRVRLAEYSGPTGRREIYLFPAEAEDDASGWSLADDFPVPMLRLSLQGRVLGANSRARDLLGPAAPEGRSLGALVEGLGRPIAEWLGEAACGAGLRQGEVVRALRGDRELFLQIRLGRLERDGGDELVAVLNDLTELKALEAQFVQSQKMQAIGQLAGGVAHDFNNLLTAIGGHCDLLLLRHDPTDADYADLQLIAQNTNRAAALVGQLLAFSRKQNLQPQVLDLREVLADHAHLLNRLVGERNRLTLDVRGDLPPVRADRRQFEQVIMNLVVNARDAMPAGGEIRVCVEARPLARPLGRHRATIPQGDWAVVTVCDTGHGIPEDRREKIFEPFYTTKKTGEGTGLGLSTAYGIVKQSGGYIFVDSVVGQGSTFEVWLPVHRGATDPVESSAETVLPRPVPAAPGGVVLLVEDEAPVRAFAARALRLRGFTVIEAASADEALALIADPALRIDVFVTDVVMPGIDGPTWVSRALRDRPDVRVVFVSGYAEDSVAEHQARIPGAAFLPKPFSLSDLTTAVAQQLS